jgi:hypothetical protein
MTAQINASHTHNVPAPRGIPPYTVTIRCVSTVRCGLCLSLCALTLCTVLVQCSQSDPQSDQTSHEHHSHRLQTSGRTAERIHGDAVRHGSVLPSQPASMSHHPPTSSMKIDVPIRSKSSICTVASESVCSSAPAPRDQRATPHASTQTPVTSQRH